MHIYQNYTLKIVNFTIIKSMGKHELVAKYNVTGNILDDEALVSDIPRKCKHMFIENESLNNNKKVWHCLKSPGFIK